MRSIYEKVLGSDFNRLHPQIQKRFGFNSQDHIAAVGTGIMDEVWHGAFYTLPFLYIGSWRRIMFPEYGKNVPFTIENYAFVDPFGRETVTWIRKFNLRKQRRFDAYMIYSQQRNKVVDYLGSHEHLAVDIDLSVDSRGGLQLRSGDQRFYERFIAFPFPMFFSGLADVCEWFDDSIGKFRIEVNVHNKIWGCCLAIAAHLMLNGDLLSQMLFPLIYCLRGLNGGSNTILFSYQNFSNKVRQILSKCVSLISGLTKPGCATLCYILCQTGYSIWNMKKL